MRPPPLAALPRRLVDDLATAVPGAVLHGDAVTAPVTAPVTGMAQDSRAVRGGDLFAAVPGARVHGAEHAGAAVDAGALAVVTDDAGRVRAASTSVPVLVVPDVARRPHRPDRVGADLAGRGGPRRRGAPAPPHHPGGARAAGTLALPRERGGRAVAMEASSHGLALGRTAGTRFAAGVLTHLGHEHLDLHGDLGACSQARAQLCEASEHTVVSVDDAHGVRLAEQLHRDGRAVTTVSAAGAPACWRASDVRHRFAGRPSPRSAPATRSSPSTSRWREPSTWPTPWRRSRRRWRGDRPRRRRPHPGALRAEVAAVTPTDRARLHEVADRGEAVDPAALRRALARRRHLTVSCPTT